MLSEIIVHPLLALLEKAIQQLEFFGAHSVGLVFYSFDIEFFSIAIFVD